MPANPIFKIFEPGLHLCASTKQPFVAALGIGNPVAYRGVDPPQSLTMLFIFLCSELLQNNKKWPGTVYSRQYYSNNKEGWSLREDNCKQIELIPIS